MEPTGHSRSLGFAAVGSKTQRTINQDSCGFYNGENLTAAVLADGLGSSFHAQVASKLVVETFIQELTSADLNGAHVDVESLRDVWEKTGTTLKTYYEENHNEYHDKAHALQTTLVTLVDLPDRYIISYLGNGSVLYIRGDFWRFHKQRWPWCITDLLVPHSCLEDGRDALYGLMSPRGDVPTPTVLQVSKDNQYGEIFVLCSDGISSLDHLRSGYDSNNKLWIEINPHIESLVNVFLVSAFEAGLGNNTANLRQMIARFLHETHFEDDATLGIILSQKAMDFYLATHSV